jgi:rare lipoprotein A
MRSTGKLAPALALLVLFGLSACGGAHRVNRDIYGAGPNGSYIVGNPYAVKGVWYYPAENTGYDAIGLASWYGDEFRGNSTANGERFDPHRLTAAHTTLPLPVLVRVTNLENGRQIVLRINDRGPFHPGRIIDVSHSAAEELGFAGQGTARVRVQYMGRADGKAPQTAHVSTESPMASIGRPVALSESGSRGPNESEDAGY